MTSECVLSQYDSACLLFYSPWLKSGNICLSVDFTVLGGLTVIRAKTVGGFYTLAKGRNRLTTGTGPRARINPSGTDLACFRVHRNHGEDRSHLAKIRIDIDGKGLRKGATDATTNWLQHRSNDPGKRHRLGNINRDGQAQG